MHYFPLGRLLCQSGVAVAYGHNIRREATTDLIN